MYEHIDYGTEYYYVKDLYEAGFLYASGLALSHLEKSGKEYFFVFKQKTECERLRDIYWSMTEKVEMRLKLFADAIKSLKERLFSNERF